ncbi:6821_t:CDS:2 [Funneliformis geosporum]|uniref:6821_t:CDS:1 n=1 Tax=Funneliformis geosporum TaxID=1117311 RepID=A0A9W4WTL7_9GLOM|nr:6821_t:CDS:2 [Funneliformis geosporum]
MSFANNYNNCRFGISIPQKLVKLATDLIFTKYANCINYHESIGEENIGQEDKKIKRHDEKTNKYNKNKELTIAEIEEDILKQIETKTGKKDLPRNKAEEKNLNQKNADYKKNLEEAKKNTIENIQVQLKKNELTTTDLNDNRD